MPIMMENVLWPFHHSHSRRLRPGAGNINGYGERCGNANLCSIIPDLELKMGIKALPDGQLKELFELSHYVAEIANLSPDEHLAYVGRAAFAHKGGIHVAAMRRTSQSYQHIDPELVGNRMEVIVSELSGKGTWSARRKNMVSPCKMKTRRLRSFKRSNSLNPKASRLKRLKLPWLCFSNGWRRVTNPHLN